MKMSVTVTSNSDPDRGFELAKLACPEAVELANIMRRYLMSADGHWNGSRLVMAIAIARGTYSHEYYGFAKKSRSAKVKTHE
jgi:hypothetical protein